MRNGIMRPRSGEVLHFSEDPTIELFVPHHATTSRDRRPLVWAVGADRAPGYWSHGKCPRAMAWVEQQTTSEDRARVLGPGGGDRVHAAEFRWLRRLAAGQIYAYRLPAASFEPVDDSGHPPALVSHQPVRPLQPPEPVGDLLALHEAAGIQLRLLDNLWPFWDAVVATTMGYSGIRLANARPRP
jgi:hypothetical protein